MVIWKAKGKGRDIKIILCYKSHLGKDDLGRGRVQRSSFVSTEKLKTSNKTQLLWYTKVSTPLHKVNMDIEK